MSDIYNADYTRALPEPLKNDKTMLALANAIAEELQETARMSKFAVIYPRIDELSEDLLDILAHDLHVDWYEYDSPVTVKREILKDSVKVHKRIGTKYAVESVVKTYFGSGRVREWFEYGGEPHHFKVLSYNPGITNNNGITSGISPVTAGSSGFRNVIFNTGAPEPTTGANGDM